ncbi:MAG: HEPN domain-containing protein [Bacteroidota bacterium]
MKEKEANHFNEAKEQLKIANEELFKPEEDVVSYLVCKNSQYAIVNYLKGFLSQRGFETHENETIEGLFERCKSLDSKFNKIDLNTIDCKAHKIDSRYCEDVNKVSSCFDAADSLDTLLREIHII